MLSHHPAVTNWTSCIKFQIIREAQSQQIRQIKKYGTSTYFFHLKTDGSYDPAYRGQAVQLPPQN